MLIDTPSETRSSLWAQWGPYEVSQAHGWVSLAGLWDIRLRAPTAHRRSGGMTGQQHWSPSAPSPPLKKKKKKVWRWKRPRTSEAANKHMLQGCVALAVSSERFYTFSAGHLVGVQQLDSAMLKVGWKEQTLRVFAVGLATAVMRRLRTSRHWHSRRPLTHASKSTTRSWPAVLYWYSSTSQQPQTVNICCSSTGKLSENIVLESTVLE